MRAILIAGAAILLSGCPFFTTGDPPPSGPARSATAEPAAPPTPYAADEPAPER